MEVFIPGETRTNRGVVKTLDQFKVLSAGDPSAGGYLLQDFMRAELLRNEAKRSAMRRICRILPTIPSGSSLLVPSEESMLVDATWTTEIAIGSEAATKPYGQRKLTPRPLAKYVRATKAFFRQVHAYEWAIEQLGAAVAVPEEAAFLTGSGVGEPLGLLSAGCTEVETSAATKVDCTDVRKFRYSLPAFYQPGATFLCHTDLLTALAQDTTASAFGTLGLDHGTILDVPVELSDSFPSGGTNPASQTAGTVVAAIGDFSFYWIQASEDTTVQRIVELGAEANQNAYIVRQSSDGAVMVKAAFRLLKIKA